MTDAGIAFEAFGNTTKLPASDAGGSELTSSYYVDDQVYKQIQNGENIEYMLDPAGRTRETIVTGSTSATKVTHYDGPGSAVAWTSESPEQWTRDIPGFGGTLAAVQTNASAPILQLHDLQGNIVATAADGESETKLLSKYNSSEFGVPTSKEAPPKYAWLGSAGLSSELPSGVVTEDGVTYVPQTGLPIQTEGIRLVAPQNGAVAFSRSVEAWVGANMGEGIALALGKTEEENAAREAANQPPGAIPIGDPAGCEEVGTCEGGGSIGGGSGCSIGCLGFKHLPTLKSSLSLGYIGCRVWATIHVQYNIQEWDALSFGYFKCDWSPPRFQMETCVEQATTKGFTKLECKEIYYEGVDKARLVAGHAWEGKQGLFRAWVWGKLSADGITFESSTVSGEKEAFIQ